MTGNASARHGSMVMTVAVAEAAHVQLAGRRDFSGPWAWPEIIRPHMPQMPSRQSESNAIGSSPAALSCSLSTSSISRKRHVGAMSVTV